ncbi:MAG: NUDIX domain-containing protein [Chloroflexi bacterium]|nr:NUDIX domain-containing protein [Chloroflexota bacterium]
MAFGRLRPHCPACGFTYFHDPKVAVAVILAKDSQVLLSRRNHDPQKGAWSFPAGYVDAGERVEEAGRREVREETNLEIAIDRLLGVYSEAGNPVILIVYTGRILSGVPHPGPEAAEVRFFPPDEVPPLAFPHDRQVLEDWLRSGGKKT